MGRARLWPWLAVISLCQGLLLVFFALTRTYGTPLGTPAPPIWASQWSCPAPKHVYFGGEIAAYLLAPIVVAPRLGAWLLQIATLAVLALLEERVARGRAAKRTNLIVDLIAMYVALLGLRFLVGYAFSRGFGWSHPEFFFSGSIHECGAGMLPSTVAILVAWDCYIRGEPYSLTVGKTHLRVAATTLHVALVAPLILMSGAFWWTLSAIAAGLVVAPLSLYCEHSRQLARKPVLPRAEPPSPPATQSPVMTDVSSMLRLAGLLAAVAFLAMALRNHHEMPTNEQLMSQSAPHGALLTFIVMSAPRPGNPEHLLTTVRSLLERFPARGDALYGLFRVVVFTSFKEHEMFDDARTRIAELFPSLPAAFIESREPESGVKGNTADSLAIHTWVRLGGGERIKPVMLQQRVDFASAITATQSLTQSFGGSAYYALVEDDFPLCDYGWDELKHVLHTAHRDHPQHCGLFVATGGSGLVWKASMSNVLVAQLLEGFPDNMSVTAADLIVQDCLRGVHPRCLQCSHRLVTSERLLMHHIGFNSSTGARSYSAEAWQCGWRQPFNGEVDVITV